MVFGCSYNFSQESKRNMRPIISVYNNFKNKGGAQEVVLQLATALNEGRKPLVLTSTPYPEIHTEYLSREIEFQPFNLKTIFEGQQQGAIFLSHHRKMTSVLAILKKLPFFSINLVHIAHSTFNTLHYLSFFPEHIIAVSNGVKENIESYFRINPKYVTVIFNGIKDFQPTCQQHDLEHKEIHILWLGRICPVKQQVEFVRASYGKLSSQIKFFFAGSGADLPLLLNEIKNSSQYQYIGEINTKTEISNYDYVCLFSKNEGLGLSLVEGLCAGKPLITNRLASVLDVNSGGVGYTSPDFNQLIHIVNNLPQNNSQPYKKLSFAARCRYLEFFCEETMVKQYQNYLAKNFP